MGSDAELEDLTSPVTWIDVRGLGDGSIVERLGAGLGMHRLAISDVVNVGQRPKVEQYDEGLFVVLRMATRSSEGPLSWEQVSLFVRNGVLITFQETHEDCLEPLRERLRAGRRMIRGSGADFLAGAVIDAIVDGYFPVLEEYGDLLELLEDQVLEERDKTVLRRLYAVKRDLSVFRRATWPLREALSQLVRDEGKPLSDTTRLHLRDTLDHMMQVHDVNESYRELGTSLVDVHLSLVGQRTNDIMRVLTVVSAVFIPLTFVAGVYGMNFDTDSPYNLPELGWTYGYVGFWIACLCLGIGLVFLFRRLGWFRR